MPGQVETGKFKLHHNIFLLMGWKKDDGEDAGATARGAASARIKGSGPGGSTFRNPKALQVRLSSPYLAPI